MSALARYGRGTSAPSRPPSPPPSRHRARSADRAESPRQATTHPHHNTERQCHVHHEPALPAPDRLRPAGAAPSPGRRTAGSAANRGASGGVLGPVRAASAAMTHRAGRPATTVVACPAREHNDPTATWRWSWCGSPSRRRSPRLAGSGGATRRAPTQPPSTPCAQPRQRPDGRRRRHRRGREGPRPDAVQRREGRRRPRAPGRRRRRSDRRHHADRQRSRQRPVGDRRQRARHDVRSGPVVLHGRRSPSVPTASARSTSPPASPRTCGGSPSRSRRASATSRS